MGDGPAACLAVLGGESCGGALPQHMQVERNTTRQQPDKQPRLRPSSSSLLLLFPPFFSHTLPFLLSSPSPFFFLLFSPSFFLSAA